MSQVKPYAIFAHTQITLDLLVLFSMIYITGGIHSPLFPSNLEYPGILVIYLIFTAAILIMAFLITSLKLSLRTKGRELLKVSRELDASNAKLMLFRTLPLLRFLHLQLVLFSLVG